MVGYSFGQGKVSVSVKFELTSNSANMGTGFVLEGLPIFEPSSPGFGRRVRSPTDHSLNAFVALSISHPYHIQVTSRWGGERPRRNALTSSHKVNNVSNTSQYIHTYFVKQTSVD